MWNEEYLLPEERLDQLRSQWKVFVADYGGEACRAEWGKLEREIAEYDRYKQERDRRFLVAPPAYKDWDYWERGNLYLPDLPYTIEIQRLEFAGFRRYQILKKGGSNGNSCFYREPEK